MKSSWLALARFLRDEEGPTAVEYAVMLALIITICITAIMALGSVDGGDKVRRQGGAKVRRTTVQSVIGEDGRVPSPRTQEAPRCTPTWSNGPKSVAVC
jgi:pilus assembly protein Flp/PilA